MINDTDIHSATIPIHSYSTHFVHSLPFFFWVKDNYCADREYETRYLNYRARSFRGQRLDYFDVGCARVCESFLPTEFVSFCIKGAEQFRVSIHGKTVDGSRMLTLNCTAFMILFYFILFFIREYKVYAVRYKSLTSRRKKS